MNDFCDLEKQEFIWLAANALGVSNAEILARKNFSNEEYEKIYPLIQRRRNGEPLQYILKSAFFYGREFVAGKGALIPRTDTETIITAAKKFIPDFFPEQEFVFLDWGTGTGCIAITILLEFPKSYAYMLDISNEALFYAKENLKRYNLNERAKIIHDLDLNEIKKLDVIFSNPPYIKTSEINSLMPDVKNFEPLIALDGGADGMNFYSDIISLMQAKNAEMIFFETGNLEQVESLKKNPSIKFLGQEFDGGNFPRCVVFTNEFTNEITGDKSR